MNPNLYVGSSPEIVDEYCGPDSPIEKALAPYQDYIKGSETAELKV